MKNLTPPERIEKILEYLDIKVDAFGQKVNDGRAQSIYDILNGKTKSISNNMKNKIIKHYPEISEVFLLAGVPPMLKAGGDVKDNVIGNNNIVRSHVSKVNSRDEDELETSTTNNKNLGVPYYNVDFAGGWHSDEIFSNVNPEFYINSPEFKGCDFACNLAGDSISKIIPNGYVVGFKIIERWKEYFPKDELYGVVTQNGFRTIKLARMINKIQVSLRACPKEEYSWRYDTQEELLDVEQIIGFYQVVAFAHFGRLVQ